MKKTIKNHNEIQLDVEGMTCASCVHHVEKAIEVLDTVEKAVVNLATQTVNITFHGANNLEDVVKAVKNAGYNVVVESVDLDIDGMTCASCANQVEKILKSIKGVESTSVNLATNRAHINFLSGTISVEELQAVVINAGYGARRVVNGRNTSGRQALEARRLKRDFIIAFALMLPIFILEMGGHLIPSFHCWVIETVGPFSSRIFQFVLTTIVLFGPGLRFFKSGIPNLLRGYPDMNSLVAVGAFAAWAYSIFATFFGNLMPEGTDNIYFEAAAVIVTLILLGRLFEARAKGQTGKAIQALAALKPKTARVIKKGNAQEMPLEDIVVGDLIEVRPGDKVPVDGSIEEGASFVDESMMTGEPMPVLKEKGALVFSGTINGNGSFIFRAQKVGNDMLIAQIQKMVEDAQAAKLPIQELVDKITAWFVPAVFLIAIITFSIWLCFGPTPVLPYALIAAVAVLIVACPCAMGLATPTSIMVATGRAAQLGILFRGGDTLQALGETQIVAFDKTGTLTVGRPELVDIYLQSGFDRIAILGAVASIEKKSEHPIGEALCQAAKQENIILSPVIDFFSKPGFGISGIVNGQKIIIGTDRYMKEIGAKIDFFSKKSAFYGEGGMTPFYVAVNGKVAAIFAVTDLVRSRAKETIAALKTLGVQSAMITGDNRHTAQAIAQKLDITEVKAEVLPEGKVDAVLALQKNKKKITFVGDGINDAPALATADIGIAIGSGTDVAIESSDVVLMSADPVGVVNAIALSRATMRNIKENLFWAFAYNVVLIPVAAGLFYPVFGVQLSPMLSAGAMAFSSVFVVFNALRLRKFKPVL